MLTIKQKITPAVTNAALGLTAGKDYAPEAIGAVHKPVEYDRVEYTFKSDTGKKIKAVEDENGMIFYENI